jgi:hypothetical protein
MISMISNYIATFYPTSIYLSVCLSVYRIISKSETSMKPTSNLHVSSMEPPSKLHQLDYMREPTSVDTGAFKTSTKPTSNLHVSSMEPPSKLHQLEHTT